MPISNYDRAKKARLGREAQRTPEEIIKARDKLIEFVNKNPRHHSIFLLYEFIHKLNLRLLRLKNEY